MYIKLRHYRRLVFQYFNPSTVCVINRPSMDSTFISSKTNRLVHTCKVNNNSHGWPEFWQRVKLRRQAAVEPSFVCRLRIHSQRCVAQDIFPPSN